MQRDEDFDPIDAVVNKALSPDRSAADRLSRAALVGAPSSRRSLVPALAAFAVVVAGAIGLTRYVKAEPPIEIRGGAGEIVIERGSGSNRTIETLRDRPSTGGIVIIREGGEQ